MHIWEMAIGGDKVCELVVGSDGMRNAIGFFCWVFSFPSVYVCTRKYRIVLQLNSWVFFPSVT